jgi:hypothetical protein
MTKTALPLLLALLCCQPVSAQDLSTQSFFKHLVGEWNAEGVTSVQFMVQAK